MLSTPFFSLLLYGAPFALATPNPTASALLDLGLKALGGQQAIDAIKYVSYEASQVYRTQTLMEAYSLRGVDRFIATQGRQNLTFSFTGPEMQQRIDRFHYLADFWDFADLTLQPLDYSIVVHGGDDGWACYTKGNNQIFIPPDVPWGYANGILVAWHIFQMQKMSPLLLSAIKSNANFTTTSASVGNVAMPAIHDRTSNMTVIFDPNTNLPHTIRSYEDHYIFGPSTNDLSVYNYTKANGVMFPRRFKTYYNGNAATQLLADFLVDAVTVNPKLPSGYFDGLPTSATETVMEKPVMVPDYGFAQVGEWSTNNLWSGTYGGKLSNLSATHPIPDVPQFWHLTFLDDQSFTQIVMEFDDAVIVGESPVHQSHLVIQWINEVLKRNITHIWPTHHHHDHSYGTKDYINAGAKLICFDGAVDYWSKIPGIEFETFSETTPFIKRDANLELRIVKMFDIDHAEDMSYGFISRPCPKENDTVAIYEADFWNPGLTDYRFNQYDGGILLDQAAADGVSREAIVLPVHGNATPLTELIEATNYMYPNWTAPDFSNGGALCVAQHTSG